MASIRRLLASILFSSTAAVAQTPPAEPPRVDITVLLNLDAARAEQVHTIMKASHAKIVAAREQIGKVTDETSRSVMHAAMEAIRTDTDSQLATVLTPEELDKLHLAMAARRHRAHSGASG